MSFGRLGRGSGNRPMSDINMTPLIDVMLVLLVIFIISAPLIASGLRLDLPEVEGAESSEAANVISVAIDRSGQHYLDESPVSIAELMLRLQAAARRHPDMEVQLRADRQVPYGQVAELLGALQQAGLFRIGFITEPPPAPAQ